MKGFYISKIAIKGPEMKDATVRLLPGLNVISGPSNKGKSYIEKCIDYGLGGSIIPKKINEVKGYTTVWLEIICYDGRTYTIARSLIEEITKVFICETTLEEFNYKNAKKIPVNHDGKKETLSLFLIRLCGFEQARLKKNIYNKTVSFTFRILAKLVSVDETRIITEESPVYKSGQRDEKSVERSLFHFLLTRKDYSDLVEEVTPTIRKGNVSAKVELIDSLIAQTQGKLDKINESSDKMSDSPQEISLSSLVNELSVSTEDLEYLAIRKQALWTELTALESKSIFQQELINRFSLLKDHYQNDLKRIEFLKDGAFLLSQLNSINCPLCGGAMDESHSVCLTDGHESNVGTALEAEFFKIRLKIKDLQGTLQQTVLDREKHQNEIQSLSDELLRINHTINESIEPAKAVTVQRIEQLLREQSRQSEAQSLISLINFYTQQRNDLQGATKKKASDVTSSDDASSIDSTYVELNDFCDSVLTTLNAWKFPGLSSVGFNTDSKVFDLVVSGKERMLDGKGHRALTYSAFLVGLMNYCFEKQFPHPFFIVIDSPVTNYQQEGEKKTQDIPDDVADSFFENLSTLGNGRQIIVIENKEPNEKVKKHMNYVDYYKDGAGLFPAIEDS